MLEYARMGFASNSSSSHSILLLNEKTKDTSCSEDEKSYSSGFLLTNEKDKMNYLLNQCLLNFEEKLGRTEAKKLIGRIFNKGFRIKEIDHQSTMILSEKINDNLKIEFLTQLVNYISKNEKIGIFGFWDSESTDKYDAYPGMPKSLFTDYMQNIKIRKEGDYQWTLFDKEYGYKVKLKLNDTINPITRPLTPELLDVSITDKCFSNCSFCYRGSNKDGKFAKLENIKKIIDGAKAQNVLEIVFGGGEPVLHPDFPKILEYTKNSGICANFTTNDTEWEKDKEKMFNIIKNTSSLTVSIHSLQDMKEKRKNEIKAKEILEQMRKNELITTYSEIDVINRITYQIIADLIPEEELKKILEYAEKTRTLLSLVGFKNTGRAKDLVCKKHENLKSIIESIFNDKESYDILSVDTCFLKEYPEFTQEITCNTKEGWESYFIDATNEYFSISSFSPEIKKVNLNGKSEEIENIMYNYFKNLKPQ